MVVIYDREYRVESYGRGSAYVIKRKRDGAELYLHGDEALDFASRVFEQSALSYGDAIAELYGHMFDPLEQLANRGRTRFTYGT